MYIITTFRGIAIVHAQDHTGKYTMCGMALDILPVDMEITDDAIRAVDCAECKAIIRHAKKIRVSRKTIEIREE